MKNRVRPDPTSENTLKNYQRVLLSVAPVAQFGRARGCGPRGPGFKSRPEPHQYITIIENSGCPVGNILK